MKFWQRKSFWPKWLKPKPSQAQEGFYSQRSVLVMGLIFLVFAILALRALTIQVFSPSAEVLETLARRQYQTKIDLSPYRGNIFDRRGEPLAISIRRPSLYANPRLFEPTATEIKSLSSILNVEANAIRKVAKRKNYFAWLARRLDKQQAEKIDALQIKGLYQVMEPARFYPGGRDLEPLLGTVGSDNHGIQGIELSYDGDLQGENHPSFRNKDARGQSIYRDSLLALPEKAGKNLILTLDSAIQSIAQKALLKGLDKAKAKSGFVIVSDPHTGRLLALANADLANPGLKDKKSPPRNHALLDIFEPGSVVKPLVIGRAVDLGLTSMQEIHQTFNGTYSEDNWQIRDTHGAELMSTEEIIVESSNIGTFRIAKRMGPESLATAITDFGFGGREQILSFPGQMIGRLSPWQKWRPIRFANVSFGQGFYASGIEIVQAFGALANGGNLMKPYLVDRMESSEGTMESTQAAEVIRRVLQPQTAYAMREALRKVVEHGTGRNAQLSHWTSAGKTGTSEKVDPLTKKYSDHLRIASFVGFAPSVDPHLVIYVVVDEPSLKPYYGGTWAAPIFKDIAEETLRYLNVAPDKSVAKEPLAKTPVPQLEQANAMKGKKSL